MNKQIAVRPSKPSGWSRSNSIGSNSSSNSCNSNAASSSASIIPSPPSSEMCSLIGFAYRLGSVVHNNDPNMDGSNSDVHREAKLLMSLSCSSPVHTKDERVGVNNNRNQNSSSNSKHFDVELSTMASAPYHLTHSPASSISSSTACTGRITPTHSITSISSGGSRRDTFCFTCPSLSLDNTRGTTSGNSPGVMLSRTLRLDDKDAMRLSSEAMARNIIESFQKAIVWRIQSWVDSLSRVLVIKEMELKKNFNSKGYAKAIQELYFSKEALLVKTLREIEGKVQVLEATTAFKVLNKVSQVDETGSALKKRRMGEEEDRTGLEEGEYVYDVTHVLEMQCSLNICTPAGNIRLDLNVPGKINGNFFSSEDDESENKLTDVTINLNTDMMAAMIEKSSRIAVRVSSEGLLNGNPHVSNVEAAKAVSINPQGHNASVSQPYTSHGTTNRLPTRSPKRKFGNKNVSGLVFITPARKTTLSPSSFGESSDSDGGVNHPVLFPIPIIFPTGMHNGKLFQPQASRVGTNASVTTGLEFAGRLAPKKYMLHKKGKKAAVIVTPLKTKGPGYIEREQGPNLPILMETGGFHSRKK